MQDNESTMIESVKQGIVTAIKGGRRLGSAIVSGLPQNPRPYEQNPTVEKQIGQLTPRELEVLQFIAGGMLNKQAAAELGVSTKTIEKHRQQITSKLGVRGTASLTHYAIYAGIIECNPQLVVA